MDLFSLALECAGVGVDVDINLARQTLTPAAEIFMSVIKSAVEKNARAFNIDTPSICPHCGVAVVPMILTSHFLNFTNPKGKEKNDYRIFVEHLCPKCLKIAVSEYRYRGDLLDADYESTFFNSSHSVGNYRRSHETAAEERATFQP